MNQRGFLEPRSICTCGHTGDGPNSQHDNTFIPGSGKCLVDGCGCNRFTWKNFNKKFERFLSRRKEG